MWNGGIPYRLKLYIDILTQPGLLFGFDPAKGYFGLLNGKKATVVYSSGVFAPGVSPDYGVDFQSSYLDWWLRFIGVADIQTIRYQPSLLSRTNSLPSSEVSQAITSAGTGCCRRGIRIFPPSRACRFSARRCSAR